MSRIKKAVAFAMTIAMVVTMSVADINAASSSVTLGINLMIDNYVPEGKSESSIYNYNVKVNGEYSGKKGVAGQGATVNFTTIEFEMGPIVDKTGKHYIVRWAAADSSGEAMQEVEGLTTVLEVNNNKNGGIRRTFNMQKAVYITGVWGSYIKGTFDYGYDGLKKTVEYIQGENGKCSSYTIAFPSISRDGYFLSGWECIGANGSFGSNTAVKKGNVISADKAKGGVDESYATGAFNSGSNGSESEFEFKAIWKKASKVNISYNANGGTLDSKAGYTLEQSEASDEGFIVALPSAPTKNGYSFAGWQCSLDNKVYQGGSRTDTFLYDENDGKTITFLAKWNKGDNSNDDNDDNDEDINPEVNNTQKPDNDPENQNAKPTVSATPTNRPDASKPPKESTPSKQPNDNDKVTQTIGPILEKEDVTEPIKDGQVVVVDGEKIIEINGSGVYYLEKGKKYKFTLGSWLVNGDGCSYNGNIVFYVGVTGYYTITKN